ncbi:unnamed protein product [Arctia plantaginis]|uniref:Uncharacterized protein n=1 Tax=Arctia plantaginis TaxID=874455 RepID=A0A8S1AJU8_ARCPL|nr:unnamed protein product [Arctia plantaginis]
MRGITIVILCCTLQYAAANFNRDTIDFDAIERQMQSDATVKSDKFFIEDGKEYEEFILEKKVNVTGKHHFKPGTTRTFTIVTNKDGKCTFRTQSRS